ncbi:MAG: ABC transporter permease [Imperialibacter sp.]|uniref:ABC transporter permease n=1 Tax=Imperialibacter sp. TaxID=2038411 RepID=UPI0032EB43B1
MRPSPPKHPLRFLRWFCREDYLDEIEGDLIELFEKRLEGSTALAKRRFVWDVVKSFRLRNIRSFGSQNSNYTAMFRHTLLLAFRNFKKYKSAFFINLIGLTSGLTCTLLIYLWVNDELHVDQFYANNDRLYQVLENREQTFGIWTAESNSGPMAESLRADVPEIEYVVEVTPYRDAALTVGENTIRADYRFVGKDYFNVFSFKLLIGNKDKVLADKSSIVLTEEMAEKLFQSVDQAIGKTVEFDHNHKYIVSGVVETVSNKSSQQFDFLLPVEVLKGWQGEGWSWYNTFIGTYMILKPGADVAGINERLKTYVTEKIKGETNRTPFITRYSERYLYGTYENGVQSGGRIEYVRLFSIIAVFILFIACINFTNLATAKASRRIKEVGIKKAVGAGRSALVFQYIGESVFMAFISLLVAVLLTLLLLPKFGEITGKQLALQLDLNMVVTLLAVTLVTGLLAGSYPAFYLAGFNPAAVLKGRLSTSAGELWARKGLVVFQFVITIVLITSVLIVYKQVEMVQSKNLGYDKDQVMLFRREGKLDNPSATQTFLAEIKNIPGVVNASSSSHDMTGHNSGTWGVEWEGKDPNDRTEFENVTVNYGLMETIGIQMKEGRTFSRSFGADSSKIIFSEEAVKYMGMEDPIGKTIKLWGEDRQIIGIAKDFHYESLHSPVKPLFFRLNSDGGRLFMVKIEKGKEKETTERLAAFYEGFNPGFPFEYRFLDQDYQEQYGAEKRVSTLSKYFAGLAILISCLGLFGLATFTAERRLKEIGIRKILGSSVGQIVYMLSASFSKMVLVAILIAVPLSFFIADSWLENYAYRIDLEWWYFAVSGALALAIAWVIVGWQTLRVASVNPTKCLRDE